MQNWLTDIFEIQRRCRHLSGVSITSLRYMSTRERFWDPTSWWQTASTSLPKIDEDLSTSGQKLSSVLRQRNLLFLKKTPDVKQQPVHPLNKWRATTNTPSHTFAHSWIRGSRMPFITGSCFASVSFDERMRRCWLPVPSRWRPPTLQTARYKTYVMT